MKKILLLLCIIAAFLTSPAQSIRLSSGDSSKIASLFRINRTSSSSDTTWKRISGIPDIDVTGGTGNGATMPWFYLITGGNHGQTVDMDSDLYVSSSGHLLCYFETMFAISNANMQSDEVTYPISWSLIGNADNMEWIANLSRSGLGFVAVGNNTPHWQILIPQLYTYSISDHTAVPATGPDTNTVSGPTTLKFTLLDGANAYLGPTGTGVVVTYHGANGYQLQRLPPSATEFNYQLKDVMGGYVTGFPQSGDSIEVFDGASHWESLDLRQFLTSSNWLFASGLANTWFSADVRLFPDSLRIGRPHMTAVASGTAGQINLAWGRVTNDANGYLVERSTVQNFSGGVTTLVNVVSSGGSIITSFNDTGLTTGVKYWYRMRASRITGQFSAHCKEVSAIAP